jgi:hypothetical protein
MLDGRQKSSILVGSLRPQDIDHNKKGRAYNSILKKRECAGISK